MNDLEWWFKINIISGYDKIVLFNNSIGTGDNFEKLVSKYKDRVEVIQMQCTPDLGHYSNNESFVAIVIFVE